MSEGLRGTVRRSPWTVPAVPVLVTAAVLLSCIGVCTGYPCFSTGLRYGLWLDRCPATEIRLSADVQANNLVRGDKGTVIIRAKARFLDGTDVHARPVEHAFNRGVTVDLVLLDLEDQPVAGLKVGDWKRVGNSLQADVTLPTVPDDDYKLRAKLTTGFETAESTLDLPLYAPAITHLMTDRPLYKPGQEVLLRSVTLKRTDQSPLEGRPGRWTIRAPDNTEMLVERDKAGPFGVADTSFPLDSRAEVGTWKAIWVSGKARDEVTFEVRPFRLPRFTVDVKSRKAWYNIGDRIVIRGTAKYSSGAPVADAPVKIRLRHTGGRWPMPLAWEKPFEAKTGKNGRFKLELGEVPADLIERATLSVSARVTEQAGEVASGASSLILSKDDLKVEAVTELGDGLVGGFNNRAYIRVMTPDGAPVRKARITVGNPWDERAPERKAETDADGVAALQLDPGDPVTVIDPAPPVRIRPMKPQDPSISSATELTRSRSLDLAERRALDKIHPDIARCGDFARNGKTVSLGVQVGPRGVVREVQTGKGRAARCVATAMRKVRFPAKGGTRTYKIDWAVPDSLKPSVDVSTSVAFGSDGDVRSALERAAVRARSCLTLGKGLNGTEVFAGHWIVDDGADRVRLNLRRASGHGLAVAEVGCLSKSFDGLKLAEKAKQQSMGTVRLSLSVPRPPGSRKSKPTTRTGYELKITARADGEKVGATRLVLPVGKIPPVRLRATPSLASPGDEIVVKILRGPDFRGTLPKELALYQGSKRLEKAKRDDKNEVRFKLPADLDGFVHTEFSGARAVVFVQPDKPLSVSLSTDKKVYRPGDEATLTVTTRAGEDPTAAGVGLSGVDSTLAQLATLLGPDEWGRVTVRAKSDKPAFGSFDPRALTLGQVRGENAAKAAVMRISHLPKDPAGDERIGASGEIRPPEVEVLTTNFYRGLERLFVKVRAWENTAPEGELMKPDKMAGMWKATLAELSRENAPVVDAYGRTLELAVLPDDLLELTNPRQVVADGTRLPEDVINWQRYVRSGGKP